jgi:hypothetical protein
MNTFRQVYYEMLGERPDDVAEMTRMFKAFLECPTAGSVETFIRKSPEFADKYRKIIADVFNSVIIANNTTNTTGEAQGGEGGCNDKAILPEAVFDRLIKRFVQDGSYTIDKMRDDIVDYVATLTTSTSNSSKSTNSDNTHDTHDNTPHDNNTPPTTSTPSPTTTTHTPVTITTSPLCTDLDPDYVGAFEDTFGRPMYVEEYFHYKRHYRQLSDLKPVLQDLLASFMDVYVQTRQYYLAYLAYANGLTMHEFVKRHLHEFVAPEFLKRLADSMISSDTYASCMRDRVTSSYNKMYDLTMHPEDATVLVGRLQSARVCLDDDGLNMHVAAFYAETVEIGDRVSAIYNRVLRRPCEPQERDARVRDFRICSGGRDHHHHGGGGDDNKNYFATLPTFEDKLVQELMSTLEFHDVLKEAIQTEHMRRYSNAGGIKKHDQYAVLSRVLARMTTTVMTRREGEESEDMSSSCSASSSSSSSAFGIIDLIMGFVREETTTYFFSSLNNNNN